MVTGTSEQYEVVWPLARTDADDIGFSGRIPSLDGKRIGFIWDHVFRGDEMFTMLERELRTLHPTASFVPHGVFGNVHGQDEATVLAALPDLLRAERIDAVVVGIGA